MEKIMNNQHDVHDEMELLDKKMLTKVVGGDGEDPPPPPPPPNPDK